MNPSFPTYFETWASLQQKDGTQKNPSWCRSYQVVGADCLGGALSAKTINVQPCGSGAGCRLQPASAVCDMLWPPFTDETQEYFSQRAPAAVSLHVMGKPETQRQRKQPSCKFSVCNLFSKPSPGVVHLLFFHICQNFLWQIRLLLTFEHFHQPFPMPHKANSRGVRALFILYTVQYILLFSS